MQQQHKRIPNRSHLLPWQIAIVLLVLLVTGCKAEKPRRYRIGIVGAPAFFEIAEGFKAKLAELGYVEGDGVCYDTWFLDANLDSLEGHVIAQFVSKKVDLIFAFPTEPAEAAKVGTEKTNIPVVFGMAGLEGNHLVESVGHPGGNITGVRFTGPASTAKRLEILLELMPHAKKVGVFYDPNYPNADPSLKQCRLTVKDSGVQLVEIPTKDRASLIAAIEARDGQADIGMDSLLIMPDILSHDCFESIRVFAEKHALPIAGGQLYMADQGALFSYAPLDTELGAKCAGLADKILRGTPAGELPIMTPENHLVLNYKRAKELGLTVPEGMLSLASRIIR